MTTHEKTRADRIPTHWHAFCADAEVVLDDVRLAPGWCLLGYAQPYECCASPIGIGVLDDPHSPVIVLPIQVSESWEKEMTAARVAEGRLPGPPIAELMARHVSSTMWRAVQPYPESTADEE